MNQEIAEFNPIVQEVMQLIDKSRHNVAIAINSEITLLYWSVGRRINDEVLGNERAEYGKQIVYALSRQLNEEYGRGWSEKHLRHCMQLATVFPNEQIVYALRRQLSWTHIRVADYLTILPTQKILEEKLHKAVEIAHQKLSQREDINKIYYK